MTSVTTRSGQYWSGFSPSNLPGLTLWYDFSDRSTFDLSGEFQITRIRDKSGRGCGATPSNPANSYWIYDAVNNGVMRVPPTASNNFVTDICLNASTLYFSGGTVMSGTGGQIVYVFGGKEPGCAFFRSSNEAYSFGQTNNVVTTTTNTLDTNAMTVGCFSGGGFPRVAANGDVAGNVNTYINQPRVRDGIPLILGSYNLSTIRNYGSMYELLLFSNILTDSERATVEDYLIDKWMKPDPPATITAPTDVSGCNLWLDTSGGASNFTFVSGTSNIVKWIDKSPVGYDVSTVGTNYPVWNGVSGYVNLNGYQMNTNRPEPSGGQETGFMVAVRVNNSIIRSVIHNGATGSNIGPNRQIITYTNGYIVRANNASPAVAQFDPVESIGSNPAVAGSLHEFSWRISGKEFFARTSGQASAYKTTPNWIDISAGGFTNIGPAVHNFRELILYDRALSFTEMSNISAYLTKKWGLSNYKTFNNPPASNRAYSSVPPFTRPFQVPYDIANCTLWLDAKDSNTIQLDSSGNVLRWLDKSGWGNDISASASRPNYSNETLVFNSNTMTVRNSNTGSANGFRFDPPFHQRFHTLIALHKPASATGNTGLIDFSIAGTAQCNVSFPTIDSTTPTIPRGYVNNSTVTGTRTTSRFLENSLTTEYNIITASIQSNRYAIYRNGVIQQDVSGVVANNSTYSGSTTITSIGRWGNPNSTFYRGDVKEIFIFNRALSTYSVAQIEAYLAKKWNLTSLLPSNHLVFSNVLPQTVSIAPLALEETLIWVDAMTYAGQYSNNATITTNWINQSYVADPFVPSGTPIFLSNAWRGRPGISLTSGSFAAAFPTSPMPSPSHQTFIVASYNTGAPATTRDLLTFRLTPTTTPKMSLLQVTPGDGSMGISFTTSTGTSGGSAFVSPPPAAAGSPFLFEVGQTSVATGGWTANGGTVSNTTLVTNSSGSYTWAGIGQDSSTNTTPTWSGVVHEIITFIVTPSNFDNQSRFQMRAYLAQKWGILGSLPTYPDKGVRV